MRKFLIVLLGIILTVSCKEKPNATTTTDNPSKDTVFQMYEMSEMAALMEQMYAYNTQLKERILNNEELGTYPEAFDKLYTAVLTDASDRDDFFNEQAFLFIAAQKAIYEEPGNSKERFNQMVNQCLECHSKKCGGPVPRIKKLLIP